MLPTQYPTNVNELATVRLVRPGMLDGIRVQAMNMETTKGVVRKRQPVDATWAPSIQSQLPMGKKSKIPIRTYPTSSTYTYHRPEE